MTEVREINVNIPKKAVIINKTTENGGGFAYCLGIIGAVVYFFQQANGFGEYVVGFLKALVWPAYAVYHLFKFLGL